MNFTTFIALLKAVAPGIIQLCKKLRFVFFFNEVSSLWVCGCDLKSTNLKGTKRKRYEGNRVIQKCLYFLYVTLSGFFFLRQSLLPRGLFVCLGALCLGVFLFGFVFLVWVFCL